MNLLAPLLARAGAWRGLNQLWTSPDDPPDESPSLLTVTPVLDGRFVRIDQTWAHQRAPQSGSLLVGYDPATRAASAHWIDTFHVGDKVMSFTGTANDDGTLDVRGAYAAPPGPDWGWRIQIASPGDGRLDLVMYNVDPEGREALAVRATHRRA